MPPPWLALCRPHLAFDGLPSPSLGSSSTTSRSRGRRSSFEERVPQQVGGQPEQWDDTENTVATPSTLHFIFPEGHQTAILSCDISPGLQTHEASHTNLCMQTATCLSHQKAMTSMAKYETVRPCAPAPVFSSHIHARPFLRDHRFSSLLLFLSLFRLLSSFHFHTPFFTSTSHPLVVCLCVRCLSILLGACWVKMAHSTPHLSPGREEGWFCRRVELWESVFADAKRGIAS